MLERQGYRIMLDEIASTLKNKRSWIPARMEYPFGRGINLEINTKKVDELYERCKLSEAHYLRFEKDTKYYEFRVTQEVFYF